MDSYKIGKFIAEKRKEKNLTQRALAEKIGVTDKAISKWERGLSCPDISLLLPLGDALGVNVTELLNGGAIEEINVELSDDILVSSVQNYIRDTNKKSKKIIAVVSLALAAVFLFTSFMFHVENERKQQHRQIDMAFSDLLCEIEMSFDYFRELSIDKNDDICRHLDKSTSEVLRLSEKYKSLLFMYYGKKMEGNICNEFDKLREDFLFIHHSVDGDSDNLKIGFEKAIKDIADLESYLDNSGVYYGSKELSKTTLQHLKDKDMYDWEGIF